MRLSIKYVQIYSKKRLLSKKLVTAYNPSKYEYCESFNKLSMKLIRNNDIRYLIVSTLTPPEGRKNGYFYTAKKIKCLDILICHLVMA